MKDQISSKEFRDLMSRKDSGIKKGRPFIPSIGGEQEEEQPKENRKVKNAKKVLDNDGNVLADSAWEFKCLQMLEESGIEFEKQQRFTLLDTLRQEGLPTLRKRTWKPDFVFPKHKIAADAKGWVTEMARLKIHLFLFRYYEWQVIQLKTPEDVIVLIDKIKKLEK